VRVKYIWRLTEHTAKFTITLILKCMYKHNCVSNTKTSLTIFPNINLHFLVFFLLEAMPINLFYCYDIFFLLLKVFSLFAIRKFYSSILWYLRFRRRAKKLLFLKIICCCFILHRKFVEVLKSCTHPFYWFKMFNIQCVILV